MLTHVVCARVECAIPHGSMPCQLYGVLGLWQAKQLLLCVFVDLLNAVARRIVSKSIHEAMYSVAVAGVVHHTL